MLTRLTESKFVARLMDSDIFETVKHSQNYFIAQIVTTGLVFLSIPIFTRLFTQEDYGIVSVYNAYLTILIIILSANSHASVGRYYFEDKPDFKEFLGSTLILAGSIFLINTLVFLLFYYPIASLMKLPGFLPLFLIFSSLFAIINSIYFQIIQAQRRSLESAIVSIFNGLFSLGLAIVLVSLLSEDRYLGRIWAYLLVGFIFTIYLTRRIFAHTSLSFKKEHVKYILNYSIPLIPYALSATILAYFDRIMINDIVGSAAAGVYSLGYNIALLVSMVISATQAAFAPDAFDFLNKKQYDRLDAVVGKLFSIITFFALGLILFAKEVVLILADVKFHEGLVVVPVVVVGYIFFGMFFVYGRYIGYVKKTLYLSIILVLSGILNITLNAMFIPQYGYIVAAYTTVLSYFSLFLMAWFVSKFILKQQLTPLWKVWKPTLLMFLYLVFFSILALVISNIFLLIFLKLIILALFFFSVFYRELKILMKESF